MFYVEFLGDDTIPKGYYAQFFKNCDYIGFCYSEARVEARMFASESDAKSEILKLCKELGVKENLFKIHAMQEPEVVASGAVKNGKFSFRHIKI